MHVLKTSFNSNPNIGLMGYCNNNFCLLSRDVPPQIVGKIEKVLKVPVHLMTMCGTSMIGAFVAGNSNCLLVPSIAFEHELAFLDKHKIKYEVIDTELTALGNNILCNDYACLASEEFTVRARHQIQKALVVPVEEGMITELNIVGALAAMNSVGGIVHRDVKRAEQNRLEKLFKIEFQPATVNMGSPYISSGILCNDNGFIIGDISGGPEIVHIEEALGFLNKKRRRQE